MWLTLHDPRISVRSVSRHSSTDLAYVGSVSCHGSRNMHIYNPSEKVVIQSNIYNKDKTNSDVKTFMIFFAIYRTPYSTVGEEQEV